MYKLSWQDLLPNGKYRNKISVPFLYCTFDVRTNKQLTLDEILDNIFLKYNKELCELNPNYLIEL